MSDRNAKTLKHFLRFSTDEFRGTGNDIFRLCMRNSGYQKGKSFLHHSAQEPFPLQMLLVEAKKLVLSVTGSPSSSDRRGLGLRDAAGNVLQRDSVGSFDTQMYHRHSLRHLANFSLSSSIID